MTRGAQPTSLRDGGSRRLGGEVKRPADDSVIDREPTVVWSWSDGQSVRRRNYEVRPMASRRNRWHTKRSRAGHGITRWVYRVARHASPHAMGDGAARREAETRRLQTETCTGSGAAARSGGGGRRAASTGRSTGGRCPGSIHRAVEKSNDARMRSPDTAHVWCGVG